MMRFYVDLEENRRLVDELRQLAEAFAEDSPEAKQAEVAIAGEIADIAPDYSPFVTGSLASSHAVFVEGDETFVAIAPGAVNPFSAENPPQYGPEVHEMGGFSASGHERAFYDVLVREEGEELLDFGESEFVGTLEVFR
jgi:hypothetical protein